jgi:hypothetical protein
VLSASKETFMVDLIRLGCDDEVGGGYNVCMSDDTNTREKMVDAMGLSQQCQPNRSVETYTLGFLQNFLFL